MKPIKNLFHDCGYIYLSTIEPQINEPITVRLRTEKNNVTYAFVEISHDGSEWTFYEMQREKEDNTGYYEYFKGTIPGQETMFKYRFRVGNDEPDNEVYYSRTYIGKEPPVFDESDKYHPDNCWVLIPGFHTPDWAKGILWYSIMPDAFYNGDITNDEPISGENHAVSWNMAQHVLSYKYGGDLRGIIKKLDYIKELGCEAIFMNPIFKTAHGAGYDPEFFNQIENSFGNRQMFEELAKAVHDRGMYYMIDVVLTFVAIRDIWFNREYTNPHPGAAQDWNSVYHDLFYFTGEEGNTKSYESVWSGPKLNHANEMLCDLLYRDKDSYLQYYCSAPYNVDAIRFDCGGALSGVYPDGKTIGDVVVAGKMRPFLRAINPEMMMLSEFSAYNSMDQGVWDSRWNINFSGSALPYMRGEIKESELFHKMDMEIHNLPRTIAQCQYNSISDHDRPRANGVEPYAYRAYQLIHMTEIGSPCIYYGDEVKNEREVRTWYAMEWDESNWNYNVLYDTKALIELRKKFSTLKSGIVKYICADDDNHILAFARIDNDSTVITVASRNAMQRNFAINTRDLGELDGTVFTDWFTGRRYISINGYIDITLPAGGTILVKGESSASYKGGFAVTTIGDESSRVIMPKDNAFDIEGRGAFVNTEVFNTCEISALCKDNGGEGMLLICTDITECAAFIGAAVCKDIVTVYVRKANDKKVQKVACVKVPVNSYVKLLRNADNTFSVYSTRTPGWTWEVIASDIHVDIPNHAKAGMISLKKAAVFEDVSVKYSKDTVLYDEFKQSSSAMFDFTPELNLKYVKAGLSIIPTNGQAQLLTNAYDEDWTFKTKLKFKGTSEGEYAGIICRQDEDIYVATGRMCMNGQQVFFIGRASAGNLVVFHTVPDTMPDRKATVQLQRIGTTYSAIYSYNDQKWHMIGQNIIANMCVERTGLMVSGKSSALFSYASFGDAINDGVSYNTPRTPMALKTDFSGMANVMVEPAYRIVSGDWRYANEGYVQTSKSLAQMGVCNKIYADFKIDGTYVIEDGNGFVGFEFGKPAYNSALGDGILFQITSDRTVKLMKSGICLAEAELSDNFGDEVKIAVENRHGVFAVYAGQEGEPILVLHDFEKTQGYVAYYTDGVTAHINNSLVASYDADFYYCGYNEKMKFTEQTATKQWPDNHGFISLFGVGVTDFILSARFHVNHFSSPQTDSYVGFYICSPEAKFTRDKALAVVFDSRNRLVLRNGKTVLASANLKSHREFTDIMVVKKDNKISVFADKSKESLLEYSNATQNGGVVSLCTNMSSVVFENMSLVDLNPCDNPANAKIYKLWMQ